MEFQYLSTGTQINKALCRGCQARFVLTDESKRCGPCKSKINSRAPKLAA